MWYHKIGVFESINWRRKVVFPSFDNDQNLTFFVTRSIDDDAFIKYQNSKADKTKIIFDELRLDFNKEMMVVEGVFDMVKSVKNTACLLGSSLPSDSLLFKKIVKNKTPIVLALDSDMATKSYNIANKLSEYGIRVKILNLGEYHDVGSMPSEIVRQKYIEAPIYSRESRLQHMIKNISSGSIF
jgi:DNA primase